MTQPLRILIAGSRRVPRSHEAKIREAIQKEIGRHFTRLYAHRARLVKIPVSIVHGACPEPKVTTATQGTIPDPHNTSVDAIAGRLGREVYDGEEVNVVVDTLDFAVFVPVPDPELVCHLINARVPFEFIVPEVEE